jgi:hypothetical protein
LKEIRSAWHALWNAIDSTYWGHWILVAPTPAYVVALMFFYCAAFGLVVWLGVGLLNLILGFG